MIPDYAGQRLELEPTESDRIGVLLYLRRQNQPVAISQIVAAELITLSVAQKALLVLAHNGLAKEDETGWVAV